jgi:hypothetical protein
MGISNALMRCNIWMPSVAVIKELIKAVSLDILSSEATRFRYRFEELLSVIIRQIQCTFVPS